MIPPELSFFFGIIIAFFIITWVCWIVIAISLWRIGSALYELGYIYEDKK